MARILIIDDDSLVRETIKLALALEEHEVVLAHDIREAPRLFCSGQFDLVICDVFAPDLTGLKTISEIRGLTATTRIIAMSAGFADVSGEPLP